MSFPIIIRRYIFKSDFRGFLRRKVLFASYKQIENEPWYYDLLNHYKFDIDCKVLTWDVNDIGTTAVVGVVITFSNVDDALIFKLRNEYLCTDLDPDIFNLFD